ncbi:biofilm PGA synthesis protein PgaA [Enterobacter cloacae]|uniref:Biofilm PGA synthesis protein PgaA n=1 Tax=Enterobacter cloacae TaxID=550 RepID=A0A377LSI8_ENTCL|nr:biofilm PGA synthesis protein PgaA [Enterobacter cloacae]
MTRNVPWARYDYGSPTAQPNDQWLIGQSLTFQYLLATHALPQAEAVAHRLAATAPGNQGLQIDYAALLQARGLPRPQSKSSKWRRYWSRQIQSWSSSRLTSRWICRSGDKWNF